MVDHFDRPLKLAEIAATHGEVPVGAVVLHRGRVLGEGCNQREQLNDPCGHAEIFALRQAAMTLGTWRLVDCELIVTLEPCPMCLAAAQQARIGRVIYGAQDPKGGALSLGYMLHMDTRTNHRFEARYEADSRCSEILTRFFRELRGRGGAKDGQEKSD